MSHRFPLSPDGTPLPLYLCIDPLTSGLIPTFTDPARVPVRGHWVVVTDDEKAWHARFDPCTPVPLGHRILGVARALLINID